MMVRDWKGDGIVAQSNFVYRVSACSAGERFSRLDWQISVSFQVCHVMSVEAYSKLPVIFSSMSGEA